MSLPTVHPSNEPRLNAEDDSARLRFERDAALRATQAAFRDTTRLTRLLTILSEPGSLESLLTRVLSTLTELFSADIAVLLVSADGATFTPMSAIGLPEDLMHLPMAGLEANCALEAARSGAPVLTDVAGSDPGLESLLREQAVKTAVWLPVVGHNAVRAVLLLARCQPAPFPHPEVELLSAMTYRSGLTLEQARTEQALRTSDDRFRALIRSVSDVIAILGTDGTICFASPAAEAGWGCPAALLLGMNVLDRVHAADSGLMHGLVEQARQRPSSIVMQGVRLRQGKDAWRNFEVTLVNLLAEPAVAGIVATFHDVTDRKALEQELTKLAYRDPLTGLANRALFKDRVEQALRRADRQERSVGVLFFDLDNFKIVNDSLGHARGDEVLCVIADRLRACLRSEDTAARIGGDEFTILVERLKGVDEVATLAERIIGALREPIRLQGRDVFVGGSMGIALSVPHQDHTDDLLRKADLAMYHAKSSGKGGYAIFDARLNGPAMERLELETDLRHALLRGQLRIDYQPILSLDNRNLCEVEALIRWQHPQRGLLLPAAFLPVAEETGIIVGIGEWVLEQACRQVRAWQLRYPSDSPLVLCVNLSAREFRHPALKRTISAVLRRSGLNPACLKLEITESDLMQEAEGTSGKLRALKRLGVRLAIDDFGTGHSSLSYLKRFPVDTLKIDRSLVRGLGRDPRDAAIVRSVVALAKAFALDVTGEGIETERQLSQLRELGCDRGQGYLFGRPQPADCLEKNALATTHQPRTRQPRLAA